MAGDLGVGGLGGGTLGGGGCQVGGSGDGSTAGGGSAGGGFRGVGPGAGGSQGRGLRRGAGVGGTGSRAGAAAVTETPPPGDCAAVTVVDRVGARVLMVHGKRVATAKLHPEMTLFHSTDAPPTVLTAFFEAIESGSEEAVYPFGQDSRFCLEKGFPSPAPVLMSSIQAGYRIAWSVGSVGYVNSI